MKLKGISKLVLAGTALAATAATLTTATYAWYVTNSKANVDQIQGITKGTAIGGSLFVATDATTTAENVTTYAPGEYTAKISLGITTANADGLWPMTKVAANGYILTSDAQVASNKTYYTRTVNEGQYVYTEIDDPTTDDLKTAYEQVTTDTWVDDKGKSSTAYLMTFKYWIKSNDASSVGIKLTTTNTTATEDLKKQVMLAANAPSKITANGATLRKGDEFAVDAVHALRMEIIKQEFDYADGVYTPKAGDPVTGIYAVDTISNSYTSPDWATPDDGDANVYYKSIVKEAGYGTNPTTGASVDAPTGKWLESGVQGFTNGIKLGANVDTLLTFNVWLEGTDAGCFDSAINQKFEFAFEFELPQA